MLNAVLFDLDNTLIDRDRPFRERVQAHFADPAVQAELLRLDAHGHGDRGTLFNAWQQHGGGFMDQTTFGRMLAGRIQPDRSLIEALRTLGKRMKLGIISNGGSVPQRLKHQASGLVEVIPSDYVWVSEEVGMAKPETAIFHHACQKLGERPENCLYVGDHEQNDVHGAKAAGLRARLVDRPLDASRLNALMEQEQLR